MPQVDVTASFLVKESQKDVSTTAEIVCTFKDNQADDYNGPIRVTIPPETSKVLDFTHVSNLRLLMVKRISGGSIRLTLRTVQTEANDLEIGRFFAAEVLNIEQVKLTNPAKEEVVAMVLLVGIKGS